MRGRSALLAIVLVGGLVAGGGVYFQRYVGAPLQPELVPKERPGFRQGERQVSVRGHVKKPRADGPRTPP